MIILGVILLILGFVLNIPLLWTLGLILAVVGAALFVAGSIGGRGIGGRRHWY